MTTDSANLLAQMSTAATAVRDRGWASSGLSGATSAAGTTDPLSALSSAGLGWFTPFVSFLNEPQSVLQGNSGPVSTGTTGFSHGGQSVSAAANQYQQAADTETQNWSGDAASSYKISGTQILDTISTLAESAYSMSDAIAGAGEVVGKATAIIGELGGQAVGEITPIMSQAIAAAPLTGGQSIAAAIPQCVAIATKYGQQMLAKLGELLASGQNLLKLVKGGLAVVQLATKALKTLSQQSAGGGSTQANQSGGASQQGAQQQKVDAPTANSGSATESGSATDAASSGLGSGSVSEAPVTSQSLASGSPGAGPLTGAGSPNGTTPGAYTPRATTTPSGVSPGGYGMTPMGAAGNGSRDTESAASRRVQGPLTGAFDTEEKELTAGRAAASTKSGAQRGGGMGAGGMGGARGAQREEDKEHRSRIQLVEDAEVFTGVDDEVIAPSVIGEVSA